MLLFILALLNIGMFAQANDFSAHTIWPLIASADASHVLYLKYDNSKGRLLSCTIAPAKYHPGDDSSIMMVPDRCQDIDGITFDKGRDTNPRAAARTVQTLLAQSLNGDSSVTNFSTLSERLKQRLAAFFVTGMSFFPAGPSPMPLNLQPAPGASIAQQVR